MCAEQNYIDSFLTLPPTKGIVNSDAALVHVLMQHTIVQYGDPFLKKIAKKSNFRTLESGSILGICPRPTNAILLTLEQ